MVCSVSAVNRTLRGLGAPLTQGGAWTDVCQRGVLCSVGVWYIYIYRVLFNSTKKGASECCFFNAGGWYLLRALFNLTAFRWAKLFLSRRIVHTGL